MKEPYGKGAATLFRPRVLGGASRGVRRSVDRGIGGPGDRAPITDEPRADTVCLVGRQHPFEATKSRAWAGRGVGRRPWHVEKQHAREPGDLQSVYRNGR